MTVAQQGPLHHLCSQHITSTAPISLNTNTESLPLSPSLLLLFVFFSFFGPFDIHSPSFSAFSHLANCNRIAPIKRSVPSPLPHWPSWRSAMWKHCSTFLTESIINKTSSSPYSSAPLTVSSQKLSLNLQQKKRRPTPPPQTTLDRNFIMKLDGEKCFFISIWCFTGSLNSLFSAAL